MAQDLRTFSTNIQDILHEIPFVKKGKKLQYANVASVFDIEASSFYKDGEKQCCMYAWVFGIDGKCIRGRTWEEFLYAIDMVIKYYNLDLDKRLIVYIHNFSYEFQFIRNHFEWEKIFSLEVRKPLYAITKNGIEFRCSYLLSGYSLEKLGDNLTKYKVSKMVGDLDYSLIRHSQTILTDKEWGYILNDGLVVMAHIQEEIERLGSITNLPLTKTGYVRNLCRERCLKGNDRWRYSKIMKYSTLDVNTYKLSKRTYTGGFTHANINYVDKLIENVHSFDFSSSYPSVMLSEVYPMGEPKFVEIGSEEEFHKYLKAYCCMFDCTFYNLESKVDFENYISISRSRDAENYILNNGRIVEASKVTVSLTDVDFLTIMDLYDWEYMEVSNFYAFYPAYLPKDFILTILDLYKDKTELKGVEGKEVEYLVSKSMINSCYGMCVTDPCRDEILYENNDWAEKKIDIKETIEKYNKSTSRFLFYPWGIWVTAYARRNLFTGILEFKNDYIYSDTDSIKVVNIDNHRKYIDDYNKKVTIKIERCLDFYKIPIEMASPKTKDGKVKPLGVWDYEGMYTRFKTLGAKRYMTEKNGEISITIAGVSKEAGVRYLKHTFGSNDNIFANFKENLHFPSYYDFNGVEENGSGKLCHTYIDYKMEGDITDYMGKTFNYCELSGIHMENTDYTLGLEEEFKRLILGIKGDYMI